MRVLSSFALAIAVVSAAAINKRAEIAHDAVVGFSESASALELKYKPYLNRESGCVPYPAVDAEGNTR